MNNLCAQSLSSACKRQTMICFAKCFVSLNKKSGGGGGERKFFPRLIRVLCSNLRFFKIAKPITVGIIFPCTLFCNVVLKRFTIGQHEQHFELTKQQFFWLSGGLSMIQKLSGGLSMIQKLCGGLSMIQKLWSNG